MKANLHLLIILIASLLVLSLTSCNASRQSGCPNTFGQVGYR